MRAWSCIAGLLLAGCAGEIAAPRGAEEEAPITAVEEAAHRLTGAPEITIL